MHSPMSPSTTTLCCCSCLRLLALLTLARLAAGQIQIPPWLQCASPPAAPSPAPSSASSNNGTTANDNSTGFRYNVVRLLDALPSSAAAASGFASLARGSGGDRAFVRGLCRGDADTGVCQTCLQAAGEEVSRNCSSRRAAIWYEQCFLTYADTNASTADEEAYRQPIHNVNSVADKVAFEKTYLALMEALAARAADNSTTSTPPMFVTGHAVFDRDALNGTMYGLVQCMRDRSPAECGRCLRASVPVLPSCCSGNQGGVVVGYNCYLRMEVYPYYDLQLDAGQPPPLSPAPSPSTFIVPPPLMTQEKPGKKGPKVILAVAAGVGTLLFVAGIVVVVFLYKWKARHKAASQGWTAGRTLWRLRKRRRAL